MDALRGTLFACAGFLFASIGFTLSVLSTFLRLFFPYHPTGAEVASTIRRRRTRESSHKRRHTSSTTNSSISSHASTSSSESSTTTSGMNTRKPRSLEPKVASEHVERPEFRNTVVLRRRRSESTPPSPSPWDISHSDTKHSADDTVMNKRPSSFHLPRSASIDFSLDNAPAGLSFLHRRKSKTPSSLSGSLNPASLPVIEKKKSQLFGPLLHKRRSQHESEVSKRSSQIFMSPSTEEEGSSPDTPERRQSLDLAHRLPPKRSQTLRTQPYEAPYFFPTPGSAEAESYLPPRRQLARPPSSSTLLAVPS
ncbi:hypothetical protein C8F04DRAFT_1067556 [Mycena alexandri]|uniref:Uncharacterized protein n=1 Tax=Mycena alexandri TaxID=1745969 RepID=A0AAD6XEJ5_9AGAR|nr:hypothetical protein C8F04DRAFT_1067556 [Mycena alexandri]